MHTGSGGFVSGCLAGLFKTESSAAAILQPGGANQAISNCAVSNPQGRPRRTPARATSPGATVRTTTAYVSSSSLPGLSCATPSINALYRAFLTLFIVNIFHGHSAVPLLFRPGGTVRSATATPLLGSARLLRRPSTMQSRKFSGSCGAWPLLLVMLITQMPSGVDGQSAPSCLHSTRVYKDMGDHRCGKFWDTRRISRCRKTEDQSGCEGPGVEGSGGGNPLIAGLGGLDDEQQVFDKEEDVQQQQLRADTVAEMDAMPSDLFMRIMLSSLFGLACQTLQTIFTAMLATFLGVCALLRSRSSSSKGGHSRATRTTIDGGGSSSSSSGNCALLRSYRFSVASHPLFFLVVALACIVPAAEAGCREVDDCGSCNSNCPGGEYRECDSTGCSGGSKRE